MELPIHIIDFEGSRISGILEYGVATVRGDGIEATHTRLCRPVGTITDRDRRQHGLSEAECAGQAAFSEDWAFFARLRETGPLGAHNAAVEDGLLRAVWPYPRSSPDFLESGTRVASWGPWVDTLRIYRRLYPDLADHSLGALVASFDLAAELEAHARAACPASRRSPHCALYDALASALLLLRLRREPELDALTVPWLLLQSAASSDSYGAMEQRELF